MQVALQEPPGTPPEEYYVLQPKGAQKTEPHTPPPTPTPSSQTSYYQEEQSGTWYRRQSPSSLPTPTSPSPPGEGGELLTEKMFGVIPGREGLAWAKAGKLMRDEAEQAQV